MQSGSFFLALYSVSEVRVLTLSKVLYMYAGSTLRSKTRACAVVTEQPPSMLEKARLLVTE